MYKTTIVTPKTNTMKRLFLSLTFACLGLFVSTQAQTPAGYAIFGDVPYGYTDLRDNIEVSIPAVISGQDIQSSSVYSTPVDQSSLTFTGNGLSGGHACQNNSALSIRFALDQNMTLDDDMVIHIKLRRTDDNTSGLMRLSMIKGTWGASRLSFQIANDEITTDISEYEFAYKNPLTSFGFSTYNQGQLIGNDVSYPGNNWKELFRFEAASGEAFEITQIYIDADATVPDPVEPAPGDEDAPTSLTLAASNIRDNNVTLTASATDANSPITYTFYYKAEGAADFTAVAGSVAAASGADAVKVVTGLTPETTYSFKVVATDPSSNSVDYTISNITTESLYEVRYYLCRGDNSDFPSSASVTSTYVDCNMEYGNHAYADNRADYLSVVSGNNSWTAITFKPKATVANDIDDDWYIVVRMRTNMQNAFDYNRFRLNLASNAQNWYLNNSDGDKTWGRNYNDNQWIVIKKRIGDRRSGSTTPSTFLLGGQIAAQLHVDNGLLSQEYIDIDYIYFTNDISDIDEGTDNSRRIKLDESEDISNNFFGIANNTPLTVDLRRSFIADGYWYTLCLPCSMTAEQIADAFGTCRIAHLSNSVLKSEDALYLDFEDVNTITAGQPYLFLPSADVVNPLLCGTYKQDASRTNNHNYAGMTGVYAPTDMSGMSDAYLLTTENTLAPVSGGTLKGFRAYFTLSTTPANGAPARIRFVTDTATSVDAITTISADKVIENGQLYIIRNGMKYNIQGQIVEPVK